MKAALFPLDTASWSSTALFAPPCWLEACKYSHGQLPSPAITSLGQVACPFCELSGNPNHCAASTREQQLQPESPDISSEKRGLAQHPDTMLDPKSMGWTIPKKVLPLISAPGNSAAREAPTDHLLATWLGAKLLQQEGYAGSCIDI